MKESKKEIHGVNLTLKYGNSIFNLRKDISTGLSDIFKISCISINKLSDETGLSRNTIANVLDYKKEYNLETAYIIAGALMDTSAIFGLKPRLAMMIELWQRCPKCEQKVFKYFIENTED